MTSNSHCQIYLYILHQIMFIFFNWPVLIKNLLTYYNILIKEAKFEIEQNNKTLYRFISNRNRI